jgi:hypothetical protein
MKNPFFNPIWSHYIVSRVTQRCLEIPDVLHVSHDAILTREVIPTGAGIGEWKCERSMSQCRIERTDYWGDGETVLKHSGITGERAKQWKN